jgi:hypothetical protein
VKLLRPAACLLAACLLGGCAQSVDPIERLGRKAAQRVRTAAPDRAAALPPYRRWGLDAPPARAPRPPGRPLAGPAAAGSAPAVDHVPTSDRVIFLTYDDTAERDPRFVDMVRELRLPVSVFLTDDVVGPGYAHFAHLMAVGASMQNHTLDHTALRGLPYAGQRAEICRQQDKILARFGVRPRLLRPPYGVYDTVTRRAAAGCGVSAVVLWRVTAATDGGLRFASGEHRLRPGDIVLVGSDEQAGGRSPRERTTALLRRARREKLAVGRLEDYL